MDAYNVSVNGYAATMARLIEWQVGDFEGFNVSVDWILGALAGPPEPSWGGVEGELTHCLFHVKACLDDFGVPIR